MKKFILIMAIFSAFLSVSLYGFAIIQDINYKKNSIDCIATVTDVRTRSGGSVDYDTYEHHYYGNYTAKDKNYTDKFIYMETIENETPTYPIGQKIPIKVDSSNPSHLVETGKTAYIFGSVLLLGCGFFVFLLCCKRIDWSKFKR